MDRLQVCVQHLPMPTRCSAPSSKGRYMHSIYNTSTKSHVQVRVVNIQRAVLADVRTVT